MGDKLSKCVKRLKPAGANNNAISLFDKEQHILIVFGFVRQNFPCSFPTDLIRMMCDFSLCHLESAILTPREEATLLKLLHDQLSLQSRHQKRGRADITGLDTKLLFRASEHSYSANKFHELCDQKGSTIVVIHNHYDHVYGGYTRQSWDKERQTITDPETFLFCIRPRVEAFGFRRAEKKGEQALWNYQGYGPLFGRGNDVWITDKCNESRDSGYGSAQSFKCTGTEFGASDEMVNQYGQCYCTVDEYEVFGVNVNGLENNANADAMDTDSTPLRIDGNNNNNEHRDSLSASVSSVNDSTL